MLLFVVVVDQTHSTRAHFCSYSIAASATSSKSTNCTIHWNVTYTTMFSNKKSHRAFLESLDRPLSALALNCCQFGCCIADQLPDGDFVAAAAEHCDWMTQLSKVSPDLKLRDLVLPGSHDSASYTVPKTKLFSAVALTQNCSIGDQLRRGIRYLDLRVAGSGDNAQDVYIYHGFLKGGLFTSVLDEILQFMEDYPTEFVFLDIVQEYGRDFTPSQKQYMLQLVQLKLGSKVYKENNKRKCIQEMTLEQICNPGTPSCVVTLHSRFYNFQYQNDEYSENFIVEKYGFFKNSRWFHNQWHNTRDIETVLEGNKTEVTKHCNHHDKMLCNQFVLTPGVGGPMDVLKLLIGNLSLRPISFSRALYKRDVLDKWLRDNAEDAWNIVMLDFIDLVPALLNFLISLNFPQSIQITEATVQECGSLAGEGGQNVTSQLLSSALMKRNQKSLYLVNIPQDLGLPYLEGVLKITYAVEGQEETKVLEIDFDETTEIVVSQYNSQNNQSMIHVN